jgi:hypothetical protein
MQIRDLWEEAEAVTPLSTGKCKISDLFEESILWGLKI